MSGHQSGTIHFESSAEVRDFVSEQLGDYRSVAEQYDTYEAATAIRADFDLCPWSIATQFESPVPFDELAGPDPTDSVNHLATLCLEEVIAELLG
ncbi:MULTISPECIES: hypothetical protein [unclassified Haloferax]|uniref:hypothetical protein n=1 Tax=unclassified Haloferax TaxID=2625095 RepID=UPI0028748F69|nr:MULTISPECIES: hypothetical protein [unclassified Haloferax]MDS0243762.1 hypothetical protein [Haloferax sp. S2CR25]MDS0446883.1 hypothetical protein [Haloferax sp. S2CR25-2]